MPLLDEKEQQKQAASQPVSEPQEQEQELDLDTFTEKAAKSLGVPDFYRRMVRQESGGSTSAVSYKGARGQFQLMPETAKQLKRPDGQSINPDDVFDNAYGGLKYLRDNYDKFKSRAKSEKHAWSMAIAAYHAGPGRVEESLNSGGDGIPDFVDDGLINTREHTYRIVKDADESEFIFTPGIGANEPIRATTEESNGANEPIRATTEESNGANEEPDVVQITSQAKRPTELSTQQPEAVSPLAQTEPGSAVTPETFIPSEGSALRMVLPVSATDSPDSLIEKAYAQAFRAKGLSEADALREAHILAESRQVQGRTGGYSPFSNTPLAPGAFEESIRRGQETIVIDNPDDIDYIKNRSNEISSEKFNRDFTEKYGEEKQGLLESAKNRLVQGFANTASTGIHGLAALSASIDGLDIDADKTELYRQGTLLAQDAENLFPADPRRQNEYIAAKIPEAMGSSLGFLVSGLAGGPVGIGVTGALSQAGSMYNEAKAANASEQQATDAAWLGVPIGMSEMVPVANMANRLKKFFPGVTEAGLSAALKEAGLISAKEGYEELIQNTGQGVLTNVVSNYIYQSNKPIFGNVAEDAIVGTVTGALLGGGTSIASSSVSAGVEKIRGEKPEAEVVPTPPGQPQALETPKTSPSQTQPQLAEPQIRVTQAQPGEARQQASPRGLEIANEFIQSKTNGKRQVNPDIGNVEVPDELSRKFADWYDDAKHNPDAPEVKKSYDSLTNEVGEQYQQLVDKGIKFEPWDGQGEPYRNSAEMRADMENGHLYYFRTDKGFGENKDVASHPMLQDSPFKDMKGEVMPWNDVFRAVHDAYAHWVYGFEFGPRGEWNATRAHAETLSPEALPALLAETQGQNSFVNVGKHLRREDGSIPQKGDIDFTPPQERRFADQKAVVPPAELTREWLSYNSANAKAPLPSPVNATEGSTSVTTSVTGEAPAQLQEEPAKQTREVAKLGNKPVEILKEDKIDGKARLTVQVQGEAGQRFVSPQELTGRRVVAAKEASKPTQTKNPTYTTKETTKTEKLEGAGKTPAGPNTIPVDGVNVSVDSFQKEAFRRLQQTYGDTIQAIRRMDISEEAKQTRIEEAKDKFQTLKRAITTDSAIESEKSTKDGWLSQKTTTIREAFGSQVNLTDVDSNVKTPTRFKEFTPVRLPNGKTATVIGSAGAGKVRVRLDEKTSRGQNNEAVIRKSSLKIIKVPSRANTNITTSESVGIEQKPQSKTEAKPKNTNPRTVGRRKSKEDSDSIKVLSKSGEELPNGKRYVEQSDGKVVPVISASKAKNGGFNVTTIDEKGNTYSFNTDKSGAKFVSDKDAAVKGNPVENHPGLASGTNRKRAGLELTNFSPFEDALGRPVSRGIKDEDVVRNIIQVGDFAVLSGVHGDFGKPGTDDSDNLMRALVNHGFKVNDASGMYQGQAEPSFFVQVKEPADFNVIKRLAKEFGQTQVMFGRDGKFTAPFTSGPDVGKETFGSKLEMDFESPEAGYTIVHLDNGKDVSFSVHDLFENEREETSLPKAISTSIPFEKMSLPKVVTENASRFTGDEFHSEADGETVFLSPALYKWVKDNVQRVFDANIKHDGAALDSERVSRLLAGLGTIKAKRKMGTTQGLTTEQAESLAKLHSDVLKAKGSSNVVNTVIIHPERTVNQIISARSHEAIHTEQLKQGGGSLRIFNNALTAKRFLELPGVKKWRNSVAVKHYASLDGNYTAAEIVAHFLSGEWKHLGISDKTMLDAYEDFVMMYAVQEGKADKLKELTKHALIGVEEFNGQRNNDTTSAGRGERISSGETLQDSPNAGPGSLAKTTGAGASGETGSGDGFRAELAQTSYKSLNPLVIYHESLTNKPRKIDEVAKELESRTRKAFGTLDSSASETKRINRGAAIAAAELKYQLAQERLGKDTGRNWYKDDVAKMEKGLEQLYPELADKKKMTLFKTVIAITSGAAKPNENLRLASEVWEATEGLTKPLPDRKPNGTAWGLRPQATKVASARIQALIKEYGEAGAADWLLSEHPVRELKKYNVAVQGKLASEKPGMFVFGPKYGAFALNLHGIAQETTVDQWFIRSWRRWMGNFIFGEKGKLHKGNDKPTNKERRELTQIVGVVINDIKKESGVELTPSEVQAMLWYYEQELWRKHGAKNESQSYSTAVKKLIERKSAPNQLGLFGEAGPEAGEGRPDAFAGGVRQGDGESKEASTQELASARSFDSKPLTYEDFSQPVIETPEFKKWFGDSKVVDESGEPLVVYHGSLAEESISVFDIENSKYKTGFFATSDNVTAQSFASRYPPNKGKVYSLYLKIEKPFVVDAAGNDYFTIPTPPEMSRYVAIDSVDTDLIASFVYKNQSKYDGAIIKNVMEGVAGNNSDVYIAFNPEQIKSATDNSGRFNSSDSSILASGRQTFTEQQQENQNLAGFDRDAWLDLVLDATPDGVLSAKKQTEFDTLITDAQNAQASGNQKETRKAAKALLKFYGDVNPSRLPDLLNHTARAAMLLGIQVAQRNAISNAIFNTTESIARYGDYGIDWALYVLRYNKQHESPKLTALAKADLYGLAKGFTKGAKESAKQLFKPRVSKLLSGEGVDSTVHAKFPVFSPLAKIANLGYSLTGAQDKPFREYARYRAIYDMASTVARNTPGSKAAKQAAFDAIMQTPPPEVLDKAELVAQHAVFQQSNKLNDKYQTALSKLDRTMIGRGAKAALNWVQPFVKTNLNIGNAVFDFMGIRPVFKALIDKEAHKFYANRDAKRDAGLRFDKATREAWQELTPEQRRAVQRYFSRGLVGSGLMAFGMFLYLAGKLTPWDDDETQAYRNNVELSGAGPGHVRLGNYWLDIRYTGPVGAMVLAGGTFAHIMHKQGIGEKVNGALNVFQKILLESNPMAQTAQELFKDTKNGRIRAVAQPERFIPPLSSEIARLKDSGVVRDTTGDDEISRSTNRMKARIPGLRETLPVSTDVLGREKKDANPLLPFAPKPVVDDEVVRELGKHKTPLVRSDANKEKGETPTQLKVRQKAEGKSMEDFLKRGINQPGYQGNEAESLKSLAREGKAITTKDKLQESDKDSNARLIVRSVEAMARAKKIVDSHPELNDEQKKEVLNNVQTLFTSSKASRTPNLGLPKTIPAEADITAQLYSNPELLQAVVESFILEAKAFKP